MRDGWEDLSGSDDVINHESTSRLSIEDMRRIVAHLRSVPETLPAPLNHTWPLTITCGNAVKRHRRDREGETWRSV